MKLIFIRHGESIGNLKKVIYGKTDYDLTPKGLRQSEVVCHSLNNQDIDAIFASPLKRTQYLAQLIAKEHDLKVNSTQSITEMNYGLLEGLTPEEVERDYCAVYENYLKDYETYIISEGEGYFQFRERVHGFLRKVTENEGNYIVVTHSGVIRESLTYLLDLKSDQVWRFKIEPACLIEISYEKGYGTLEQIRQCL